MQDIIVEPLKEIELARLIKSIRQQEDSEHVAQFCADISSVFARIARYVGKVGFQLSDEWKNANHLVLSVREHKTRLLAIHIRATGDGHDHQGVDVSCAILRRREEKSESFRFPEQMAEARFHVLGKLFAAFPKDSLMLPVCKSEKVPLFESLVGDVLAPTWDEGVMKQRAQDEADKLTGPFIRGPFADDNVRVRSFSR